VSALPVPVFSEYGLVEMADPVRVRQLLKAPNAEAVVRHKDGRLMRFQLHTYGDDYAVRSHHGNPQNNVTNAETDTNPRNVWAYKRHCGAAAARPHR
jgi:hypothetical protein